jgi:N-acetylneuraminic acid mutarotase
LVERYYPRSNRWDTLSYRLNQGRVGAVAAVYNNDIYVFGGHFVEPLDSYEKFVPGQGWQKTDETMLYACGSAAGVFAGGKIWLAGGQGNAGILNRVQSFEMNGNSQWQEETALQTGRKSLALAAVKNAIYAIGGNSDKSKHITFTAITIYDMLGKKVRLLYEGSITGWQQFQFDGRDKLGKMLPSGQYFLYLTTANEKHVQKIILAK